jgi:hypothetical protein
MATASEPIHAAGMTIQLLVEADESNGSISSRRSRSTASPRGSARATSCTSRAARVHGFAVGGDEDASILCIATPGLLGAAYFREMAGAIEAAGDGPPDREAIVAVMRRHGLTPAIPGATLGAQATKEPRR